MQQLILFFTVYSVLGWVCECIYCAAIDKVWVNRGFLTGPVCPVYGFGSMFVILLLNRLKGEILLLFIISVLITTILEYITAVILEKAFNLKWWDYSTYKFNYKGRICLLNSVLFGLLSIFLIEFLHPLINNFIGGLPHNIITISVIIIVIIFIFDLVTTIISLVDMNEMLHRVTQMSIDFTKMGIKLEKFNDIEFNKAFEKLKSKREWSGIKDKFYESYNSFKEFRVRSSIQNRIMKAFPDMRSNQYGEQFKKFKEVISDHWKRK